jgi:transposase-like protein
LLTYHQFSKTLSNNRNLCKKFIEIFYENSLQCPKCQSDKLYTRKNKPQIVDCGNCRNTFSIFKGTSLEKVRIGIRKFLYITYSRLIMVSDVGQRMEANELAKQLKTSTRSIKLLLKKLVNNLKDSEIRNKYKKLLKLPV